MTVLHTERRGATVVLTIARAHAGNSISPDVTGALSAAVATVAADPEVRAVVITGEGDRYFSTGGDIKQYRALETREQLAEAFVAPRALMDDLEALPVPVVAAINGWALGGGAELALACDLRVAAAHARIGFPYVRLGIVAGWNGVERLARICGYGVAMRLLATGEPVEAEEARRLGLVNEVASSALEAALGLCEPFARAAPLALAATKRLLRSAYVLPPEQLRSLSDATFASLWVSEDHREAEAAFAEKRETRFRGR